MRAFLLCFGSIPVELCQFSRGPQTFKVALAENLVDCDCNGIGEIERSKTVSHGDPHASLGILMQKVLGKSATLFSEEQVYLIGVANVGVAVFCLGGKTEKIGIRMLFKKIIHAIVIGDVQLMPIVKSCTLELFIVDGKAERSDQMERGAGGSAGARDVSRVLGDFGLVKNNVNVAHKTPRS